MYKSTYNKNLIKFKDIHKDESAILFATGPTIKEYESFEGSDKCIKVGLNKIYDYKDSLSDLDYYFLVVIIIQIMNIDETWMMFVKIMI